METRVEYDDISLYLNRYWNDYIFVVVPNEGCFVGLLLAYKSTISFSLSSNEKSWIMGEFLHSKENIKITFIGTYREPKKENKCYFISCFG